jgi:hypothetical protein
VITTKREVRNLPRSLRYWGFSAHRGGNGIYEVARRKTDMRAAMNAHDRVDIDRFGEPTAFDLSGSQARHLDRCPGSSAAA